MTASQHHVKYFRITLASSVSYLKSHKLDLTRQYFCALLLISVHVAAGCAAAASASLHLPLLLAAPQYPQTMLRVKTTMESLIPPLDFTHSPSSFATAEEQAPRPSTTDSWVSDNDSDGEVTADDDDDDRETALAPLSPSTIPLPDSPTSSIAEIGTARTRTIVARGSFQLVSPKARLTSKRSTFADSVSEARPSTIYSVVGHTSKTSLKSAKSSTKKRATKAPPAFRVSERRCCVFTNNVANPSNAV